MSSQASARNDALVSEEFEHCLPMNMSPAVQLTQWFIFRSVDLTEERCLLTQLGSGPYAEGQQYYT